VGVAADLPAARSTIASNDQCLRVVANQLRVVADIIFLTPTSQVTLFFYLRRYLDDDVCMLTEQSVLANIITTFYSHGKSTVA
jgi:hypothetical protein